jgi:macrodomain Ter protein organizer (MatP/YcbG family)
MALKTFNIDSEVYRKFSLRSRKYGVSMSKTIENFIRSQVADEPEVREEYLARLEEIRKGKFVKVGSFSKRYGL